MDCSERGREGEIWAGGVAGSMALGAPRLKRRDALIYSKGESPGRGNRRL
jgi:hypothetical protein